MAQDPKTINIDFKSIADSINRFFDKTIKYFKNLSTDMIIAWSAVGLGFILLIVGIIIV